jgi:hypothetical protein
MRFEVNIGEEFEISEVTISNSEIIKAETELNKARQQAKDTHNRTVIAWAVLSLVTVFLIGASILGVRDGEFSKLQAVYNVAAVPMSAILAYYFGQRGGTSIKR